MSIDSMDAIDVKGGIQSHNGSKIDFIKKLKEFEVRSLIPILAEIVSHFDEAEHDKIHKAIENLLAISELNFSIKVKETCVKISEACMQKNNE